LWAPDAALNDAAVNEIGKYYARPAAEMDGSRSRELRLRLHQPGAGVLPVVQASPAGGMGAMTGVTYIQRGTQGRRCTSNSLHDGNGAPREIVKYQTDYIFWKAA
jgi:hypothetical protein